MTRARAYCCKSTMKLVWLLCVFRAYAGDMLPRRFDHPYRGKVDVVTLSPAYMDEHYSEGMRDVTLGFTYGPERPGATCVVYVNGGHPRLRKSTIRHEIGHCNGWPSSTIPRNAAGSLARRRRRKRGAVDSAAQAVAGGPPGKRNGQRLRRRDVLSGPLG
jgi:hypothetical protein